MLNLQYNVVEDIDLNNSWREVMLLCVHNGQDYVVKQGSYEGQIRKQLPHVRILVNRPWTRPLAPIVPPPYPAPTSDEKIREYFLNYLMSSEVHGKEDYTYGSYIVPQLDRTIKLLVDSKGNTNQACISVGNEKSIFLQDPPCLRTISFKVVNKRLQMSVFFRSWDLYAGLPENLGGLQLLKEYTLSFLEDHIPVVDGPLIAYSDGLHLYDQYFDLVNALNIKKIEVSKEALEDKKLYNQTL